MLRFIVISLCCLVSTVVNCQVDSFLQLASQSTNDSTRFHHGHNAVQRMHDDTALILLHQYLASAHELNDTYWKAKLTQTLAKKCSQINGNIDSLYLYSKEARDLFLQLGLPVEVARSTMQMGMAEMNRGNRSTAMEYLTEAATIFEREEAYSILAPVYINISSIFHQSEDYETELNYLLKAHAITLKSKDLRNQAIASMGIQARYVDKNKLDSAAIFATDAMTIAKQLNDPILIRYSALNLGELAMAQEDTARAEHYYLRTLTPKLVGADRATGLYWIGLFYANTKQFQKAHQYLMEADELAQTIGAHDLGINILSRWIDVLANLGYYKNAFDVSQRYKTMLDSFHSAEVRTNINELTIKYESEKKERENQVLAYNIKQHELEILQLNGKVKQQILIVVLSILSLCSMILFYFFAKRNQAQKNQIVDQKNALQEQKIKDLETEKMLLSIKSLVRGQEEERSRIAKELHDGLGSIMSSLKLSISQLPDYGQRMDYQQHVQHVLSLSDHANVELRRIAQNLMPETLTRFGLIAALEDFIAEINYAKTVNVQFQYFYTDETLPNDLSLSIYRIIQELLQNAIKHAQATDILVQLMKHGDLINITVEDDGVGFTFDMLNNKGSGFKNIESRLAFFAGSMRVESNEGEGSTIFIECPINYEITKTHESIR